MMINISCFISRKYCIDYIRVVDNRWEGVFLIIVYNAVQILWCGVYMYHVQQKVLRRYCVSEQPADRQTM